MGRGGGVVLLSGCGTQVPSRRGGADCSSDPSAGGTQRVEPEVALRLVDRGGPRKGLKLQGFMGLWAHLEVL